MPSLCCTTILLVPPQHTRCRSKHRCWCVRAELPFPFLLTPSPSYSNILIRLFEIFEFSHILSSSWLQSPFPNHFVSYFVSLVAYQLTNLKKLNTWTCKKEFFFHKWTLQLSNYSIFSIFFHIFPSCPIMFKGSLITCQ